jgi:hypothetical protein
VHQLAVLRFCRDVLSERQRTDKWQGWFWAIRRKVVEYWIARLEHAQDPAETVPELTPEEQQAVRGSHPLLAARPVMSNSVLKIDSLWQVELQGRVRRYVAALGIRH